VHITEADVILNVHKAFWAYQLTRSFVRSLREGDEILAKVIRTVEGLIADDSPQVTENDRLRLVHAQAALRVRLHEADSASKVALAALHLLTGTPHGAPLLLVSRELDEVPPPPPPVEALLAEARVQRPELRALLHLIDAAEHYVRFRTRGFFPDFFIGVFISSAWTSNATDQTNPFIYDRFNVNDAGLGIGMRFQLDVFTKLAEVKQAQAQLDVQIASHSAAEEAIELEVRKVHLELVGNLEKLDPAEKAFRASRGWLTAAVLAYDLGVGDASELIDAFLARATSEGDLRKTQFDLLIGAAELERAAGDLLEKSNL
jgi:outer membrane protein TolC